MTEHTGGRATREEAGIPPFFPDIPVEEKRKRIVEVFAADITHPAIIEHCYRFRLRLPKNEREKAGRFLKEDDRLRCIAGRLMIRTLAAERLGMSAPEIRLTEYGKPYIAGAEGFCFNLSHSGAFVVLAVSDAPVGVDIERVIPMEWQDIAQTFSFAERELLRAADDPMNCFYRIWTVREAFAKEEGIGLTLFDGCTPEFDYSRGTVSLKGRTLHFVTTEAEGHIISVCCPLGYDTAFRPVYSLSDG